MTTRVQAWLRQADSDLAVGQLTEAKGFHSQACYHYSQAAEKALKGALISVGETLENPAILRENGPVIAGVDWLDGDQAVWFW